MMFKKLLFVLSLTPSLSSRMRMEGIDSELEAEGQGKGKTIVATIREPPEKHETEIIRIPIEKEKQKPEPKQKKRTIIAEIPIKEEKYVKTVHIPQPVWYPRPHYHPHPILATPPAFVGPYPQPGREYILPPAELVVPVKATIAALQPKYPMPAPPHPPMPHPDHKDPRVAITLGGDASSGAVEITPHQYTLQSQYQEAPTEYAYPETQWAQAAYMPQTQYQHQMPQYQWTWNTQMNDPTSTTPTPAYSQ